MSTKANEWIASNKLVKSTPCIARWLALGALAVVNLQIQDSFAQLTTAWNYQGQLNERGSPANGFYDLRLSLYDALTNGDRIGTLTNAATPITNGVFLAPVDFGAVFNGSNYWLELAVRTNGDEAFTVLCPRQQILPVPYALYSASARSAATAASAASLTGALADSQLSSNVPLLNGSNAFTGVNSLAGITVATNLANVFNGTEKGSTHRLVHF
jgi:hypothetical protein